MRAENGSRVDENRVRIGNLVRIVRLAVVTAFAFLIVLVLPPGRLFSQVSGAAGPLPGMSSETVREAARNGDLYFLPHGAETAGMGFILYPGAKVPKEAYAYIGRSVAEAGYPAILVDVPLGFAIFGTNAASRAVSALPGVRKWVLSGHSLGGVAASIYAKKNRQIVAGMIFLASYPSKGGALNDTGMKVLSIRASNDKLTTREKVEAARRLLPESARYVVIEGGNHAQFGTYGPQRNDGAASIPAVDQQRAVLDSILAFLASVQ